MKLMSLIKDFAREESGAVTQEVQVLAAAGAFLGITALVYVATGVEELHEDTKYQNRKQELVTTF